MNTEKTEVQYIGLHHKEVEIKIEDHELKQVNEFVYLGGTICEDASMIKISKGELD